MKLICFIFVLTISQSLTKKGKEVSSEVSSAEGFDRSISADDRYAPKRFQKIRSSSNRNNYFKCVGKLRRTFAIEKAYEHSGGNVVCSPVSALLPLGKLVLGVEGQARPELLEVIGEHKKSTLTESFTKLIKDLQYVPGVKLDVASRIYVGDDVEIVPKFAEDTKTIFASGVEKISFQQSKQAADEINGWVSRQTNGMIPLLLQPNQIDPNTLMVIVNAIYFKGKWKFPFTDINVGEFFAPIGPKKVQLMNGVPITCRYTKSDILNAEIVEIPYEGEEANFLIILPLEKTGLPLLLNQLKLAPNLLTSALRRLRTKLVNITIPKFSITTSFDLKEMYEKIGVKKMMSAQSGLTKIVKGQQLTVSRAVQKAVIEVHERGTEASAASAVVLHLMGARPTNAVNFTADHPFLFYVQAHKEQLFAGIYSDP